MFCLHSCVALNNELVFGDIMNHAELTDEVLTDRFSQLGRELGITAEPVVYFSGWWTKVYLPYAGHALQMEINREFRDVHLYVVRCIDGKLPPRDVWDTYPDGSWYRQLVKNIYSDDGFPVFKRKNGNISNEGIYEQMLVMFEYYRNLILRDPARLLNFIQNIDKMPAVPGRQTEKPAEKSVKS